MKRAIWTFYIIAMLLIGAIHAGQVALRAQNGDLPKKTISYKMPIQINDEENLNKADKENVGNSFAPTGLYVIVRNDALMQVAELITLQIADELNTDMNIPDQSGSSGGVNYDFSSFLIIIDLEQPFLSSSGAPALTIGWGLFNFIVQFNYHICSTSWPNPCENGYVQIYTTDNNVNLNADLNLDLSGSTFSLTCTGVNLNFNQGDIQIFVQCTDTFCLIPTDDIANAIAQNFVPTFQQALQTAIDNGAASTINTVSTTYPIADLKLQLNFNGDFALFPSGSTPNFVLAMEGMFTPDGSSGITPPFSPTVSPPDSVFQSPPNQLTFVFTEYMIRTAIWALDEEGDFNITITNSDLPPNSPVQLTTNDHTLVSAVPGFKEYPNMNVNIQISMINVSSIDITGTPGIVVDNFLYADFIMTNSTLTKWAFTLAVEIGATGTISAIWNTTINEIQLDTSVGDYSVGVTLVESGVGNVNEGFFKFLISVGLGLEKPAFPNVAVPNPPDFTVSSPAYNEGVGYAELSSTFVYAINVPMINCAADFNCPLNCTCCSWSSGWGCCTLPNASCCDGAGCCPEGTSCDGQGGCE